MSTSSLWCGVRQIIIWSILTGVVCSTVAAVEDVRCVCMMDKDGWFSSFDLLRFKLPLPCTYRMARLRTRTGCDMTVDVVMTLSSDADEARAAGMTYYVKNGINTAEGVLSAKGVEVSDPLASGFGSSFFFPRSEVEIRTYTDDLGFMSAEFPACFSSLHFQPDGYLGIYSRNDSQDVAFSRDYLCGDCNGGKSEMRMLGSDVTRRMRTWEDHTAALLLLASMHIVDGNDQCEQHANAMTSCSTYDAYRANQVCGCILSPHSQTGRCMRTRTSSRDRIQMYYACVQEFCSYVGSQMASCNMIRNMIQKHSCPSPDSLMC